MKSKPEIAAAAVKGRRLAEREELERSRDASRATAERARKQRTSRIEAGVEMAYAAIKARLEAMPSRFRPLTLRRHIENKIKETPRVYGLKRIPGLDVLRRVCRRLNMK